MLRAFIRSCLRSDRRFGLARDPRSRLRAPGFVSFLADNNRRRHDADFHDTVLRGRRLGRRLLLGVLVGGGAWVLLESARALTLF